MFNPDYHLNSMPRFKAAIELFFPLNHLKLLFTQNDKEADQQTKKKNTLQGSHASTRP